MNPDATKEKEREKLQQRVETLAGEIAGLINTSDGTERNNLRDLALSIVREEVRSGEETSQEPGAAAPTAAPFSPILMGVLVFLMGCVMVVLFPPVGLLLFGVAFLLAGWGLVVFLVSNRASGSRR